MSDTCPHVCVCPDCHSENTFIHADVYLFGTQTLDAHIWACGACGLKWQARPLSVTQVTADAA